MADDLLITPGSRKLEIKDTAGNVDAKIETDASGNLLITNAGGDISIGDTSSDVFIGDGTNNVDIVFEQNGEIRGTSGVTITLGASGSSVAMATDLSLGGNDLTNVNDITISGNLTVNGTTTTLDSTNTVIEDSIIELNSGLTGTNTKDIGFIFERGSTGNNAGFVWDESADRFTVFTTTDTAASDTVDTSSVANFQAGSFYGNGANLTSLNASNISSGTLSSARLNTGSSGNWWAGNVVKVGTDGVMEIGKYIDFHNTDAGTSDFDTRLYSNAAGQLTIDGNGRILTTDDEGAGNGLDADTLDSQHGSYYTNASNLGSGTLSTARLAATVYPGSATELSSSQDLNDLNSSSAGFYYQTANADTTGNNYPEGTAGSLIVQKSAGQATQLYQTYQSNVPKLYFRSNYTSGWGSWQRVFADNYHPNADTLTTARTIGGVSFNGSANIDLPGVNTAGNQNTSGTAAGLSGTPNITVGTISSGAITSSTSSAQNLDLILSNTTSGASNRIRILTTASSQTWGIENDQNLSTFKIRNTTSSRDVLLLNNSAPANALSIDSSGSTFGGNIYFNGSTTGNRVISYGTSTQQPSVAFWGEDHASYPGQVHIVARSDNASSSAGEISFWDYTGSSFNRNVTIKKDGHVGIGIDSPTRGPLHIHRPGSDDAQIHLTNGDTGSTSSDGLTIFADTDVQGIWSRENCDFVIASNAIEAFRLHTNQDAQFAAKVGIGTGTPSAMLTAISTVDATPAIKAQNTGGINGVIQEWIGDSNGMEMFNYDTGDYVLRNTEQNNGIIFRDGTGGLEFQYNGSTVLQIDNSGGMELLSGAFRIGSNVCISSNRDFDGRQGTFSSHVSSGDNSGGVAMTINDGYGNANLTFNHLSGTPEQNGQAARIEVNTDGTSTEGVMSFEISSADVTSGVAVNLPEAMKLAHDYLELPYRIRHAGDTNTYLQFDTDRIQLVAGGATKFDSNNTYLTGITSSDVTTALGFTPISSSDTSITNKMPLAGGTFTGGTTYNVSGNAITISSGSPQIRLNDTTSGADDFWIHVNSNNFYILADRGDDGSWETPHPLLLSASTDIGYIFGQRAFTEAYHPNADTLTTARTIGGVSFNGSANIDLPGVNTAGNQNTSGTAAGLSGTPNITVGTISSGNINVGVADTTNGTLTIHGGGTGNAEGGEIRLGLSADYDGTYDFYRIDTLNDDLRIGRQGQTDFYIFQDGSVKAETDFQASNNITVGTGSNSPNLIINKATTGTGSLLFRNGGNNKGKIVLDSDEALNFYVNNTSLQLKMLEAGNVIIGGSSVLGSAKLTVDAGSGFAAIAVLDSAATNGGYLQLRASNSAKGTLGFGTNAGATGINDIILSSAAGNVEIQATTLSREIIFATGATERMKVTGDGNLKFISQTSTFDTPGITYHTNNHLYMRGGSAGLILSDDGGQNTIQISDTGNYVRFETFDGTERVRINSAGLDIKTGSLYINQFQAVSTAGTTSKLFFGDHGDDLDVHIEGFSGGSTIYMTDGSIYFNGTSNSTAGFKMIGNTGAFHSNGDVIAYSSTLTASDRRLKENVKALENPLEKVMHLQGVKYDWKEPDRGTNQIGLIAQEVEEIVPEVVNTIEDSLGELKDMKVVNYTALVPMLIEAIKEQQTIINRLEERLNNLENKGEE